MLLNQFIQFLLFSSFLSITSISIANTINFQGVIANDSCSASSTNKNCTNIQKTIKQAKLNTVNTSLINKAKNIAIIKIDKITIAPYKILVINYH